ncbi:Lipase 2 [Rubripirellula obstinata]|uniref:Lipase 2 n=1 Tax=Rubripirellula obstinata TaxID=406547 RepID=A0A5B1CEN0_9BACT|nr:alpha/beta hydrolase [Rubripirellula obstinata]KAA1257913.1 Lipase 2 [Rubripirellula obstinata]
MLSRNLFLVVSLGVVSIHATAEEVTQSSRTSVARNIAYRGDSDDPLVNQLCRLDLFYPTSINGDGNADYPTIVWLHGGGLTGGERSIPRGFVQNKIAIATADYRLSPKVRSEVCIDDAAAAVAWVLDHIQDYGGSKDRVFLSGHSAGGYLTSMVGLNAKYLAAHKRKPSDLAGLIPLSGHAITHFNVRKERGIDGRQPVVDQMAPLYHVLSKPLPPILLITGDREKEMLGRYEENAYFARMLKVAGHSEVELRELKGFDHSGMVAPASSMVLNFVQRVDSKNQTPAETSKQTN